MSKLVLADTTVIAIEAGASLSDIRVVSESMVAMVETWKKLTTDNIAEVQIQNDDGVVVGQYEKLVLVSETSSVQTDGTVLTSFHLREKTELELLREEFETFKETVSTDMTALNDTIGGA